MAEERGTGTIQVDWKPDRNQKLPLYSQIVGYFSEKIMQGDWISGDRLPPQRKLAKDFDVNRSTIVEAMNELLALGMVESGYGGGTRISNDTWSYLTRSRSLDWNDYTRAGGFHPNLPTVQRINHLEFEGNFTRLGTGELGASILPEEILKEALRRVTRRNLIINYPDQRGIFELRKAVSRKLSGCGIHVPPSCIFIVSGALQALQLISAAIVRDSSTIYMEAPSYIGSLNVFQSSGARLKEIPMDANGVMPWLIRSDGGKIERNSMLYVIPTFQNPTGINMPQFRRKEVLSYCQDHRIPIVEDDVFRELWLDSEAPSPIKAMDESGSVIYIGSMSKCLAPGLRIGWVVAPEAVVRRLSDVKMQMDYGVSTLAQQTAAELLESGLYDEGLSLVRERLRERREFVLEILERRFRALADWKRPEGGFFIWLRLKGKLSADRLFDEALKEKILITPGSIYNRKYGTCLRLNYAYLEKEEMADGMERLAVLLERLV